MTTESAGYEAGKAIADGGRVSATDILEAADRLEDVPLVDDLREALGQYWQGLFDGYLDHQRGVRVSSQSALAD